MVQALANFLQSIKDCLLSSRRIQRKMTLFKVLFCLSLISLTVVFVLGNNVNSKVGDFFPSDLSLVTWAHAVNSQAKLKEAFATGVKMLEADLQLGKVINSPSEDLIPIMAHPPALTSDLSFQDFLDQVLESNKDKNPSLVQGMKLDFKSIETVEPALQILGNVSTERINFPIWLNADILKGPVESTGNPVNATEFLRLAAQYRKGDTLSIGWTTRYGATSTGNITEGQYTSNQVQEMIDLLKNQTYIDKTTPITFPLRAGIAARSLQNVQRLLSESWDNPTVTLWSSENDPVDMELLLDFVNTITREKCFLDLPFELKDSEVTSTLSDSGSSINSISKYTLASLTLLMLAIQFLFLF